MKRQLLMVALIAAVAGDAGARKPKPAPRVVTFSVRARVSAEGGAAAALPKLGAAGVVADGADLVMGPLGEAAAWTSAIDLLVRQPWTQQGVIIDTVRVVETEPDGRASQRDAAIPVVAELARWSRGRNGKRLVTRASVYAFPDSALPPAAEQVSSLEPIAVKGKPKPKPNLAVLILGDRELCDAAGVECMAWFRVLAPARGGGVIAGWTPMVQLWIPDTEGEFQLRRLGRGPGETTWDALSRRGARTFCTVPDGSPPPVKAVRAAKKDTAALRDADGRAVGRCDDEALSPG